jgi:hypothetical protein
MLCADMIDTDVRAYVGDTAIYGDIRLRHLEPLVPWMLCAYMIDTDVRANGRDIAIYTATYGCGTLSHLSPLV